mmetsp:Transcript_25229/g.30486  ORF Transcript_25229/g.30486 Transcript_25229/m.30486 type:complete len:191 (+) Transcript_25229:83-655(+)
MDLSQTVVDTRAEKIDTHLIKQIGEAKLRTAICDDFFPRLLGDRALTQFYDADFTQNHAILKFHYYEFIQKMLVDGFSIQKSELMKDEFRRHHQNVFDLGMDEWHFDRVKQHFQDALIAQGVDESAVDEALDVFFMFRVICEEKGKDYKKRNSFGNKFMRAVCCKANTGSSGSKKADNSGGGSETSGAFV